MTNSLWVPNDQDMSVTYPIDEIMRRATLKIKIQDRNIPMTSDLWGGGMSELVGRYRRFGNWHRNGVSHVKVFYVPDYYIGNRYTLELMDPLSLTYVTNYAGIKE